MSDSERRHRYDRDPTPEDPVVRLYPHIPWFNSAPAWIRDYGEDTIEQDVIAEVQQRYEEGRHRAQFDRLCEGCVRPSCPQQCPFQAEVQQT